MTDAHDVQVVLPNNQQAGAPRSLKDKGLEARRSKQGDIDFEVDLKYALPLEEMRVTPVSRDSEI